MKVSLISIMLVVAVVVSFAPPQSQAFPWDKIVPHVIEKIKGLWQNGEFELMGHQCNYKISPKIRRWRLYFKGSMWCPGWTNITGVAMTRRRSSAIGSATTDFLKKAVAAGFITEQEAQAWLNK